MTALALSLVLTTLPPRAVAAVESAVAAVRRAKANPAIVTTLQPAVFCVPWKAGENATGKVTTRVTGLFCQLPGQTPQPCALEVIAVSSTTTQADDLPWDKIRDWVDPIDPGSLDVENRASPLASQCQLAVALLESSLKPFRCACSSGASCNWTDPATGLSGVAPLGITFTPGTWSGAGCMKKPCTTRFWSYDESWPAACPVP